MAIEAAGISLVAEHYATYMQQMKQIEAAHKRAFSPESIKKFDTNYKQATTQVKTQSTQMGKSFDTAADAASAMGINVGVVSQVMRLAGPIAVALGLGIAAIEFIKKADEAAEFAKKVRGVGIALDIAGQRQGYSLSQLDAYTEGLRDQGASLEGAKRSLTTMARAQLDLADAGKLFAVAQDASVGTVYSVDEAYQRLVASINKLEPETLDELGITLKLDAVYKKYAQTLNKSSKDLTTTEQRQAVLNEVLAQGQIIAGTYDKSIGVLGQRHKEAAKAAEDAELAFGKMTLPIKETLDLLSTEVQIKIFQGVNDFLAGAHEVGSAFGVLYEQLQKAFSDENNAKIEQATTLGFKLGEAFADAAKRATAGWLVFGEIVDALLRGDIDKLKTMDVNAAFERNLSKIDTRIQEYDQHVEEARQQTQQFGQSQDNAAADTNKLDDALEKQIDTLEAQRDALKQAQNIQRTYQENVAKAGEEYQKGLAEATKRYNKERARMLKEQAAELARFDQDTARERAQMVDDFNAEQANQQREFDLQQRQARQQYDTQAKQDKRKFYLDQLQAQRQFDLNMAQAQRRNQINDRRLRAEGDVLALMEAREDAALQQQEALENHAEQSRTADENFKQQQKTAEENFRLQEQQARDSFALQTEIQKQEFDRQMQQFDEAKAIERERMLEANAQALADLEANYEEEKAKLAEQYEEKLAMAQEQRDKDLQALGDSLKEQGDVTEEGMKAIADKISEAFGEDNAGDQLIKGWSERSKDTISQAVDEINAKINELKENLENATSTTTTTSSRAWTPGAHSEDYDTEDKPIGARHGYSGVVTGPKTFKIEPGMKEHVQITPLNRGGGMSGSMTVGGSASINVIGMSDNAGAEMEQRISDAIIGAIKVSVKRLNRRG